MKRKRRGVWSTPQICSTFLISHRLQYILQAPQLGEGTTCLEVSNRSSDKRTDRLSNPLLATTFRRSLAKHQSAGRAGTSQPDLDAPFEAPHLSLARPDERCNAGKNVGGAIPEGQQGDARNGRGEVEELRKVLQAGKKQERDAFLRRFA